MNHKTLGFFNLIEDKKKSFFFNIYLIIFFMTKRINEETLLL